MNTRLQEQFTVTARVNGNPIKFTSSPIYLRFDEVELRMLDPTDSEHDTMETGVGTSWFKLSSYQTRFKLSSF